MLQSLRQVIKSSDLTYEALAKKMGLSESTIKRLLNGQIPLTLERLTEFCEILDIEVYELARLARYGSKGPSTLLSLEQEKMIADNEALFVVFYLTVMGIPLTEITQSYKISKEEAFKLALQLESLGIVELHPKNKLKMRVYRKVRWNMDGPLHKKYMLAMAQDFFHEVYQREPTMRFFFNCPLSKESKEIVLVKLRELSREIERLSEMDLNVNKTTETSLNVFIAAKEWFPAVVRKFKR